MDHQIIEEENVAERYVAGKLPADEVTRFEEHYLDCQACIARVEDAERLHRGLQRFATEETARSMAARRLGVLAVLVTLVRSRRGAIGMALLLALAVLPAILGLRIGRLRHDLATAQNALVAARRPQVNIPIVSLSPFRASGLEPGPVHPIPLPAEPGWIVLSLEAGGTAYPAYRATLLGADDSIVWQGSGLVLDGLGTLTLSLHSTFLAPGDYLFRLEGQPEAGEPLPVARFPLRVTRLP